MPMATDSVSGTDKRRVIMLWSVVRVGEFKLFSISPSSSLGHSPKGKKKKVHTKKRFILRGKKINFPMERESSPLNDESNISLERR